MHNMCVSDRVMGDLRMYYNPAYTFDEVEDVIEYPRNSDGDDDLPGLCDEVPARQHMVIGLRNGNPNVAQNMLGRDDFGNWNHLHNHAEHQCLHDALIRHVSNNFRRG
jgi:hypothetical protein